MFTSSEVNAEVAAMTYLNRPVKVLVGGIGEKSPAAGVLAPGDQLVAVSGRPVERVAAVYDALKQTRPGQQVSITYRRGSTATQTATVTLGSRPDDGPQGFLDIMPAAEPLNPDEVVIGLTDIGGPSAGLIFALAVIDKLTPGELTGGRFVAGTGEISQTGEVGRISGIPFKMTAARQAGATVFLVPEGNCEEAAATAPEGLQLIKVGNLGQAVAGLDALREGRPATGC
ncbi:MAG: PDZ domain-containing protein, partial [Actinomycetota bacterium]|nr:PDZ domain-containing protein [Actinomycetota bacterium]